MKIVIIIEDIEKKKEVYVLKRIESAKNPRVKQWKKLYTKKGREQANAFIIEGPHLVEEAIKNNTSIIEVIVEEEYQVPSAWIIEAAEWYYVPRKVMEEISDTETPQGIAAVCEMKDNSAADVQRGKYLLIDGVQDPGNVGTMIRTADSAGLDGVILGKGTADLYNSKVLRSTQGSVFHLPILKGELSSYIERFKEINVPVIGTALEGGESFLNNQGISEFALIVGNEGKGMDKSLLEQCDQALYIPIYGKAESLNVAVAAGILLYGIQNER
jgi:RNA methyltransferase, TrmH family